MLSPETVAMVYRIAAGVREDMESGEYDDMSIIESLPNPYRHLPDGGSTQAEIDRWRNS